MTPNLLPINLNDLIHSKSVENARIDYKKGWDDKIEAAVIKTISAFANDIMNLNGGYVVLGIDAPDGVPILPPAGLYASQIEKIQQDIRVSCKFIEPEYQPLVTHQIYMDKHIVVIWVPAGDNRPYLSPDDRRRHSEKKYFVRLGPETVEARGEVYRQLIELTARIPFDDRRHLSTNLLAISPVLVKRFLREINSDLLNRLPPYPDEELYKALRIVTDIGGAFVPRNVALLFFCERPSEFFPGAVFEVVQFGGDSGGDLIEEKRFEGPLDTIITEVLRYLDNLTNIQLRKLPNQAKVERTVAYPYEALEEAIVNAAYHRSYDNCPDPNKIYLYPDRIEIISYPGPVPGISIQHLLPNQIIPPVPARNRRIGEILKELRLAEMRGTGIPKIRRTMSQNGSPEPKFDFDEERTYFRAILPAHPKYVAIHTLRESAYLWSIGERRRAASNLEIVFEKSSESGALAGQLIEYLYDLGEIERAAEVFEKYHHTPFKQEAEVPYLRYFKILISNDNRNLAEKVMDSLAEDYYLNDPVEVAVAFKRLKMFEKAHPIFAKAYQNNNTDPVFLHDYAQTKIEIANHMYWRQKQRSDWSTINRLRNEAIEHLRRAIQLLDGSNSYDELAWCWFDLAITLQVGRTGQGKPYPSSQIKEAYENALEIHPYKRRFQEAYSKWKRRG